MAQLNLIIQMFKITLQFQVLHGCKTEKLMDIFGLKHLSKIIPYKIQHQMEMLPRISSVHIQITNHNKCRKVSWTNWRMYKILCPIFLSYHQRLHICKIRACHMDKIIFTVLALDTNSIVISWNHTRIRIPPVTLVPSRASYQTMAVHLQSIKKCISLINIKT